MLGKSPKTYETEPLTSEVLPAKVEIQRRQTVFASACLDSLLQGNDGYRRFFRTEGSVGLADSPIASNPPTYSQS